MVACRVCGMSVDEVRALTLTYQGKTYYFCNSICAVEFRKDPEKYAS